MKFEKKKGSPLCLVKTKGQEPGNYDLYDLRGMTLGKAECIKRALQSLVSASHAAGHVEPLAEELLAHFRSLDEHQTIANG